jgi:hypothetical protein
MRWNYRSEIGPPPPLAGSLSKSSEIPSVPPAPASDPETTPLPSRRALLPRFTGAALVSKAGSACGPFALRRAGFSKDERFEPAPTCEVVPICTSSCGLAGIAARSKMVWRSACDQWNSARPSGCLRQARVGVRAREPAAYHGRSYLLRSPRRSGCTTPCGRWKCRLARDIWRPSSPRGPPARMSDLSRLQALTTGATDQ